MSIDNQGIAIGRCDVGTLNIAGLRVFNGKLVSSSAFQPIGVVNYFALIAEDLAGLRTGGLRSPSLRKRKPRP